MPQQEHAAAAPPSLSTDLIGEQRPRNSNSTRNTSSSHNSNNPQTPSSHRRCRHRRFRMLTVGDGDLSLSLALARCYCGSSRPLDLTASTLVATPDDLVATYPRTAPAILEELRQWSVPVLFGVDACRLHADPRLMAQEYQEDDDGSTDDAAPFDLISFHHPHLGDYDGGRENELALLQRHSSLLAHYLDSASQLLLSGGAVHVALCGNQAASWRLREAAVRSGLLDGTSTTIMTVIPVQRPFHHVLDAAADAGGADFSWINTTDGATSWQTAPLAPDGSLEQQQQQQQQPRRNVSKRHGGSRHWLGKYGYRHVRTVPNSNNNSTADAPNLTGSQHYVFRRRRQKTKEGDGEAKRIAANTANNNSDDNDVHATFSCSICLVAFATAAELQAHLHEPATPVTVSAAAAAAAGVLDKKNERSSGNDGTSTTAAGRSCLQILDRRPEEGVVVLQVLEEGKRLRWCLQHCEELLPPRRSRGVWDRIIKDGWVSVNGVVAVDTGRILQAGWEIELRLEESEKKDGGALVLKNLPVPDIEIVDTWGPKCCAPTTKGEIYVVWKPVGMRAIGSFDASTLEESFNVQQQKQNQDGEAIKYHSLSKLDTGCSGLCVLAPRITWQESDLEIVHTFVALVHGHVPKEWLSGVSIELPTDAVRRWKKRATYNNEDNSNNNTKLPPKQQKNSCSALFQCVEMTSTTTTNSNLANIPALSTITVSTSSRSSRLASIIASYLRNVGKHPVVGDRSAVTEYLSLPRSIRNRVKQKFCIGCTRVQITLLGNDNDDECRRIDSATPDKWRAGYWQVFCENSTRPLS